MGRARRWQSPAAAVAAGFLLCNVISCTLAAPGAEDAQRRLQETVALVDEVKAFEKTLGIEPTQSLSNSSGQQSSLSMLWVWLQRVGTLALRGPIDIGVSERRNAALGVERVIKLRAAIRRLTHLRKPGAQFVRGLSEQVNRHLHAPQSS